MSFLQGDLFAPVLEAYVEAGSCDLSNEVLYKSVAAKIGLDESEIDAKTPIGKTGQMHSVFKRAVRWHQQTAKKMGLLEHGDSRGLWRMANVTKKGLCEAPAGVKLIGFSTKLGIAIWGDCSTALAGLDQPVTAIICSPPYLLSKQRDYGNPKGEQEYIDFITRCLEPVIAHLAPGGSLCLNISNDSFLPGLPARSMYRERLLLTLAERFQLFKMDEIPWFNPSRPPGPVAWASKQRVQLNSGYEVIYWMTNDPTKITSDNRRVLEQHTRKHMDLMMSGGEKRSKSYGNGAYTLRDGSFGKVTEGKIPRNVLVRGHSCADTRQYRRDAEALGLPIHGAMSPLSVPEFLLKFLTKEGELCIDPFGGTIKLGMAAERNNRRWIVVERVLDYIRGSAERFRMFDGFSMSPAMEAFRGAPR